MSSRIRTIYEFGPFRLNTKEQLLLQNGEAVPLTPTAFNILAVLVRNSGHLVDKDVMLKEVWPDTFVEEANLSVHISSLRKALGEHQYIETVPSRGYRFAANTKLVATEATGFVAEPDGVPRSGIGEQVRNVGTFSHNRVKRAIFATAVLLVISAIALGLYKLSTVQHSKAEPELFQRMKLTRITSSGNAMNAAISADGKYIVHALEDAGRQSLWLRNVKTNGSIQIVSPAEVEYLAYLQRARQWL